MRHTVTLVEHDCDLHVHGLPGHLAPILGAALAKAPAPSEFPDPAWPQVAELVDEAEVLWQAWGDALVAEVLGATDAESIAWALRRHAARVILAFAGQVTDPEALATVPMRLAKAEPPRSTALVTTAAHLGLGANTSRPRPPGTRSAPRAPLTREEVLAVRYAQDHAGAYIRKPLGKLHAEVAASLAERGISLDRRELTEEERKLVGDTVARAISLRHDAGQLARDLRDAVANTAIVNDLRRIARTELQAALNHGAKAALKERVGGDPMVYKIVSPYACSQCLRIWGEPPKSIRYRLSVIEAHDRAGGNFGLPDEDWQATTGPIHPQCACGPLLHDANASRPVPPGRPAPKTSAMEAFFEAQRQRQEAEKRRQGGR